MRVPPADVDTTPADDIATDSTAAERSAADTLPPGPVFGRTVPEISWAVPLNAPLTPGSYRIRIRGARGLNGRETDTDREFRVRAAPPPAPADTSTPPTPATPPAETRRP